MSESYMYRVVNPYIEGSLEKVYRASNSFKAGKKAYKEISKYFTNSVSSFNMALQNVETKELSHFQITEKRNDDNEVDFDMVQLEAGALPEAVSKKLVESVARMEKQAGGRKHRHHDSDSDSSDSSDSDSESDYYRRKSTLLPITNFVYYYLPYVKYQNISPNDYKLFMPTFTWPISPSVEIRLDLYKY